MRFQPRIGLSLDDIVEPFKDVAEALGSVVSDLPGGDWVTGAFNSGAGFIGDMAKTTVGKTILIGVSNAMLFPAIAGIAIPSVSGMQFLGPQVASVVWALPSVAAGDPFVDSFIREVTWRAEKLLEFFIGQGASEALAHAEVQKYADGIKKVFANTGVVQDYEQLKAQLAGLTDAQVKKLLADKGLDAEALARRLWIRRDSAATAIDGLLRRPVYDVLGDEVPLDNGPLKVNPKDRKIDVILNIPLTQLARDIKTGTGGAIGVASRSKRGILYTLGMAALLTSPLWIGPVLRSRAIPKTFRRVTSRRS